MAGFFATDYFSRQAEMMQSTMSDEEIAHQLSLLYLPKAPAVSSQCASSSSTRGSDRVTKEEEDYLYALGISLKQEKSCALCAESKPCGAFLSTKDCVHEFCTDCLSTHAEVTLTLTRSAQIECPHPSCRRHFHLDQCRALLSEPSLEALSRRVQEAATPASQRVYCPFPTCSVFVPVRKPETWSSDTFMECSSCRRGFCLERGVPWERECGMCGRRVSHTEFIAAKGCAHEYCTDCCEQHAEMEIRLTLHSRIECPHPSCRSTFDIFQCQQLLSQASFEALNIRQVEAAIPFPERVYCPFPECSAFIPVLRPDSSLICTSVECHSCGRGICLECNVPWEKDCDICADTVAHNKFISTKDCSHEYCIECCKQHAEVKIMSGSTQVDCPDPGCAHTFHISQCTTLLSALNFDILNTRLTEAAIPAANKVFCPYGDCSVLMERSLDEEGSSRGRSPFAMCVACHRGFCLDCKVPWHGNYQSCAEYRAHAENEKQGGDQKLKDLAKEKGWKACPVDNCGIMVEKKSGCNHMTCWFKHEFCYKCGLPYQNKKATCACPLYS